MSGPITLKSQKGLLTRYCNNLRRLLDSAEANSTQKWADLRDSADLGNMQAVLFELQSISDLVLNSLSAFTATVDSLSEELDETHENQVHEYIDSAQNLLDRASCTILQMDAQVKTAREHALFLGASPTTTPGILQPAQPRLPVIPVPVFSGKVWEYKNFWVLFCANVHDQPLTKLQKFNYLLNALKGEARELVKRYAVSEDNYDLAVELLHKKYGNNSKLIDHLQMRLEAARADSPTNQSQRRLLEFIIPIVTQLQQENVNLDGSYLVKKILAKFSTAIQRKILESKFSQDTNESDWKMQDLLRELDHHITTEERITDMVKTRNPNTTLKDSSRDSPAPSPKNPQCMFCASPYHKSLSCTRYPTISERRLSMQQRKLCLNCGKQGHFVTQCRSQGCRNCSGTRHHHTLCPQLTKKKVEDTKQWAPEKGKDTLPKGKESKSRQEKPRQGKPTVTRTNPIHSDCIKDQEALCQEPETGAHETMVFQSIGSTHKVSRVLLLTGWAQIRNTHTEKWEKVEILFDTGADRSFINETLADELGLEYSAYKRLRLRTFGSNEPRTTISKMAIVDIRDYKGRKYPLQLYTTPIITGSGKAAHLTQADKAFMESLSIDLFAATEDSPSNPKILLGCDQLWDLLESTCPQYTLPSGLKLIPSKLGYLLTGRQNEAIEQTERIRHTELNSVARVNTFTNFDEDTERWDKYWTMDSSGICEFTGSKDAEKKATNEKVLQFFNDTIEKREDGYYVRFPYKEHHAPLPSNKAIALKRLESVLTMLRLSPDVLKEYEQTIAAQEESGIIEEIPNNYHQEGAILHYIPHQPVITPNKETTKLRIVFDASSHFTNCPSLNDILHQGPLILPELYEMLLRFRIDPYVATADVEKAFLQIRLHELDRDATRFLWVRDTNKPVEEENIITYRFTRVTFGLNVSPFLLAGTIHHHLRSSVENEDIAEEIRENLYVDNLILAGKSETELRRKANEARRIFAEMGMNLREFRSNDPLLCQELPKEASSRCATQKVLGIVWDANEDTLHIHCSLPKCDPLTKRMVARRIASVYDPFGWLVPLLTQAKRFQQGLWKHKYEWDSELPPDITKEWVNITANADGFQHSFPRQFLLDDSVKGDIAVFADASEIAISCCAYIFNDKGSTLAMAKCKLPSIHSKTTMPKLEMNALTLGVRLARSIFQAIKNRVPSNPARIYIFSDSQIALSWLSHKGTTTQFGRLVENRLKEIKEIVGSLVKQGVTVEFRYITSTENPADAGTRGLTKEQLKHHIWWTGPRFLNIPPHLWQSPQYNLATSETTITPDDSQTGSEVTTTNTQTLEDDIAPLVDLTRFSSFKTAKRVLVIVLIFVKKLLSALPAHRASSVAQKIPQFGCIPDFLTEVDGSAIKVARAMLIRDHQATFLEKGYRKTMENTLRPFLDESLIWRSRGRLGNTSLTTEGKYPIIIAPNTTLAKLIIQDSHGRYHQGIEHTMATVRSHYWIPKLRQQVRKLILRCVKCRRFNGLPFSYPELTDLPQRRVARSRPFQHVGLDFFDLPQPSGGDEDIKPAGCIFTCTVTRLVHLEMVYSMNTEDFINALRRFVARRGIPDSITCDNAPTFLLTARILSDKHMVHEDILRATSDKEIQWRYITPYAPWQGGFYERLIKSVKHALYKSLRGTNQRSREHLRTTLIEIEACLNSRPLTYLGATQEDLTVVRPIDFLQKDLNITMPHDNLTLPSSEDPDYHSPEELRELRSRENVIEALQSSCKATERFWTIWQEQYLTSLREKQKRSLTRRRSGQQIPAVGDVVLVSDPVLPRNDWRMARITKSQPSGDGNIREVELVTATRRKIRRPVNLLVPLEINSATENTENAIYEDEPDPEVPIPPAMNQTHRYNLRKRPPKKPEMTTISTLRSSRSGRSVKWFLFYLMLLSIACISSATASQDIRVQCTDTGLLISTRTQNKTIEICAEYYCQRQNITETPQLVKFPPDITLNDHLVLIKWNLGKKLATIETRCPGIDFCENIDCFFCSHVLLNPECRPLEALSIIMITAYGVVAFVYTLLYVPMTIGKPIRVLLQGLKVIIIFIAKLIGRCIYKVLRYLLRGRRRTQRERIYAALVVIVCVILQPIPTTGACQLVNVFQQNSTICSSNAGRETCTIRLMEMLKLNSFKQEACLTVTHKSSVIANINVRWKGLYLQCEKHSLYFTRPAILKTLDSKRCPKMGSCREEKCANFDTSTLVEELAAANDFPGRTGCMESCGGWGCDCFRFSSGCLFYRIYAVPTSPKVYEMFRCSRWAEELQMEVKIENFHSPNGTSTHVLAVIPNVPMKLRSIQLTATTLALPPIPPLNYQFITNGEEIAIWDTQHPPNLLCETAQEAIYGNCSVVEDCRCSPAETKVNCICTTVDVEAEFNKVEHKLPLKTPAWELKKRPNSSLIAKIPQMVSADVILEFLDTVDTTILSIKNNTCSITDSALQGCYSCSKGAQAKIHCHSDSETFGEILCGNHAFVVPCTPKSPETALRFHLESAQQLLNCSITCGVETKTFTLSGILKYVGNIQAHVSTLIQGNSTTYNEIAWPDFSHILSVFLSWYKMVIVGLIVVLASLLLSYLLLHSVGLKLLQLLWHALVRLASCPSRMVLLVFDKAIGKKSKRDGLQKNNHIKNL